MLSNVIGVISPYIQSNWHIIVRPTVYVLENFHRKFANLVAPSTDGTTNRLLRCKTHLMALNQVNDASEETAKYSATSFGEGLSSPCPFCSLFPPFRFSGGTSDFASPPCRKQHVWPIAPFPSEILLSVKCAKVLRVCTDVIPKITSYRTCHCSGLKRILRRCVWVPGFAGAQTPAPKRSVLKYFSAPSE